MTSDHPVKRRKKLIEVAIPLEAINAASAREKSIRHGHPSTLHLWWARRPLAAARAVIFCQMVDDPSAVPEEFPTEEEQEKERLRLFALISELVLWESTTNEQVLNRARDEIRRSWRRCCADNADHPEAAELFIPEKVPGFHDPFAGGGALPLEAQRLGLESFATDLNPVAVLINKAMIEIPAKFAGKPPVNPESRRNLDVQQWQGAQGLAEDVRYFGQWMRDEAKKRIGDLYPKVKITQDMVNDPEWPRPDLKAYEGKDLTVIAWIWARTVRSPNPAFDKISVPLIATFKLGTKPGKEVCIRPVVDDDKYDFRVVLGADKSPDQASGTKISGANFRCLLSGDTITSSYIKDEARAGRMGQRLVAVVAQGTRGRVYLSPTDTHQNTALSAAPEWSPDVEFFQKALGFRIGPYGMSKWSDLFTRRQLAILSTLSSLVSEAHQLIAISSSNCDPGPQSHTSSEQADARANEYADAVCTYLGLLIGRLADYCSTVCTWANNPQMEIVRGTFARQALPITWDFAEANPFGPSTGSIEIILEWIYKVLMGFSPCISGHAYQEDAARPGPESRNKVISTDPPYYDNIGYADLSDFFYVWLRKTLQSYLPEIFRTVTTPKKDELVATPGRHGTREDARRFFLEGMTNALSAIGGSSSRVFPVTIYYAFKQSEDSAEKGHSSTGWETFLSSLVRAGLSIVGTWPISTERKGRSRDVGSNALATSVVIVCQVRDANAISLSRAEFRKSVRANLRNSIRELERSNIAPVDVAQAAIGPGMSVFSGAKNVLNPDDSTMSVREALIEINLALDEYLSQEEGSLDGDSRFALTFFESFGYLERDYGDAEGLAMARNISVEGVAKAGILRSLAGKVRLLQRSELPEDWDPTRDKRLCVWEATQQLIKRLETGGESSAAALLLQLKNVPGHGDLAANCRALAYRLYNHCEKTKQAEEARSYNGLVIAWPELERQASAAANAQSAPHQPSLI
jgi:putative DNA methylase